MSSKRTDFVALALAGTASADEIDHYIEEWHANRDGVSLHEYLGMSREEYGLWLKSPDVLKTILEQRKSSQSRLFVA